MGTDKEIFQLLEERAQEIVEKIRLLKEENTILKTENTALLEKQEKAHRKVKELLNRVRHSRSGQHH